MYVRPYSKRSCILNNVTVHFQQLFTPKTRGRQIETGEVMTELKEVREKSSFLCLYSTGLPQISRLEAWRSQQSSL